MRIGVTGGTGFLGRYIVNALLERGDEVVGWKRRQSDAGGFISHRESQLRWIDGHLGDTQSCTELVRHCDALVHAALARPTNSFGPASASVTDFAQVNIIGSLQLIEEAVKAGVSRFVFISTCAVHDVILQDRKLDEAHPLWPASHYGAHKAAIEKFVHSFALGQGWNACALRPTGIYGMRRPVDRSKWYDLIVQVAAGDPLALDRGGKEVHAADVAKAVTILLDAPEEKVRGQTFNCYDWYIADQDVAAIAKRITGSNSEIQTLNAGPRNQIDTSKLQSLGMVFGGEPLLESTIEQLCREHGR